MTIFFNVTDAIGKAGNHGITRVERKFAAHFGRREDVEFVVMHERQLWQIARDTVISRAERPDVRRTPTIERFGIDPAPVVASRWKRVSAAARLRSGAPAPGSLAGARLQKLLPSEVDVLVSVGVDWSRPMLDAAERMVFGSGSRFVGFCYDLIPIDHPEWLFPPRPELFVRHFERMSRIASTIVCISDRTREDFARHFPTYPRSMLHRITLGSDIVVDVEASHDEFAATMFDGEPFAIYCATIDRRKNHQVLYRAMRELVRRGTAGNLLFVGMKGSGVDDLMHALRNDVTIRGRIAHVTDCDDRHLAALYRRARFAVYPSLYEGWGLGVTEAMAYGKRCIVASGSSLEEASLGSAHVVAPLATAAWADAITEHMDAPGRTVQVTLPTWSDAAAAMLEIVSR